MFKRILAVLGLVVSCLSMAGLYGCSDNEEDLLLSFRRDSLQVAVDACTQDISRDQQVENAMVKERDSLELKSTLMADSTTLLGRLYPREMAFIHVFYNQDPIDILEEYVKKNDGEAAVWVFRKIELWNYGMKHGATVEDVRRHLKSLDSSMVSLVLQSKQLTDRIDKNKQTTIKKATDCDKIKYELGKVINQLEEL